MTERREVRVAGLRELRDGGLKRVVLGDEKILLARSGGRVYAVGAECPHYGAPLEEGALHGERLVCPWHHACFNVATGANEEPPALDGLPRYAVRLDGDDVLVTLPPDPAPDTPSPDGDDARTFAIVGAGAAGQAAAEALRRQGFAGRIVLIARAESLPPDRPSLSKEYLSGEVGAKLVPLRPEKFYAQRGIELRRGATVERIDVAARTLHLAGGETLAYDALLIAPGATPRPLELPGAELPRVFLLRSVDDCERILAAAKGAQRAVVVGASFIGMEVAASLRERDLEVTVVAPDPVPYARVLGEEIGRMFQRLHDEHGVQFRLGAKPARIEGEGGVEAVVLEGGERIAADLVVAGVGVKPAAGAIAGLEVDERGALAADATLRVAEGVWAAGDSASFPDPQTGERIRVEHWRLAQQHGRHAARAMLGSAEPFAGVPFFWTKQFGLSLRYVGHATRWDELITWGDTDKREFITFYVASGRVVAAAGVKRDTEMAAIEELMRVGKMPPPEALRGGEVDLRAAIRR
jgi:NADPH-dependent 2,4-dienoyl-CoA reductase/sulfur reductase-like enzyme/nitrite reductase/ring-hydroxylating ferredoxin subunit